MQQKWVPLKHYRIQAIHNKYYCSEKWLRWLSLIMRSPWFEAVTAVERDPSGFRVSSNASPKASRRPRSETKPATSALPAGVFQNSNLLKSTPPVNAKQSTTVSADSGPGDAHVSMCNQELYSKSPGCSVYGWNSPRYRLPADEWSSLKQTLVKADLCSSAGRELSDLAVISINARPAQKLSYHDLIPDFAAPERCLLCCALGSCIQRFFCFVWQIQLHSFVGIQPFILKGLMQPIPGHGYVFGNCLFDNLWIHII